MKTAIWSRNMRPKSVMFAPAIPSRSGGPSITGDEQVVQSSAGRWRAALSFDVFRGDTAARILYWRWFLSHMQGRANAILIGPFDDGQTPAALAGETDPGPIPHDDDTFFDDGAGYQQTLVQAHVAGVWPLGAASIMVNMVAGHQPQPGQYFSIGERMYWINSAVPYIPPLMGPGPTYWTLGIWPTLRAGTTDGEQANFDSPACLMKFATDNTGDLALKPYYNGETTIELIEAPVE